VIASVKAFQGGGGIGLFFAIKSQAGVKGFLADTDLVDAENKQPISPLLKAREAMKEQERPKEPLYFTQFLGAAVGRKGYALKYNGKKYQSDLLFFGLRGTGPGTLFDGPPLDFNLLVSIDSPDFYKEFAQNKPNGFSVFSDVLLQLPLWENQNQIFYWAFGFMGSYSRYRVQVNNNFTDQKEFRLGGELGLGYGHRLGKKYIFRLDYKYHFEKYQNTSYWASLMAEY
jgi:hypothetical protein